MYSDLGIAVALNLTLEERRERDTLNNSLLHVHKARWVL